MLEAAAFRAPAGKAFETHSQLYPCQRISALQLGFEPFQDFRQAEPILRLHLVELCQRWSRRIEFTRLICTSFVPEEQEVLAKDSLVRGGN